jgi:hypothetical protein
LVEQPPGEIELKGVDAERRSLRNGGMPGNSITMSQLAVATRRGPYLEGIIVVRDTDPRFGHVQEGPNTGRLIFIDAPYGSPILYYPAYTRASEPFCADGWGGSSPSSYGKTGDRLGIYRLLDNYAITGVSMADGADHFWDFANTGLNLSAHPLGDVGSLTPDQINRSPSYYPKGKTFPGFLHDESALRAASVVKPVNPETFILIDAGRDGLYSTDDDVANFE